MEPGCLFCQRVESQARASDSDIIFEFPNSIAFLGRWQFYHGYTVLIARCHATELSQLSDGVRREFFDEMCLVARAIEANFQPRKLNYELLGNQVPHLHWHIFPRYGDDEHKHLPVWLATVPAEQDPSLAHHLEEGPGDRKATIEALRATLANWANAAD